MAAYSGRNGIAKVIRVGGRGKIVGSSYKYRNGSEVASPVTGSCKVAAVLWSCAFRAISRVKAIQSKRFSQSDAPVTHLHHRHRTVLRTCQCPPGVCSVRLAGKAGMVQFGDSARAAVVRGLKGAGGSKELGKSGVGADIACIRPRGCEEQCQLGVAVLRPVV